MRKILGLIIIILSSPFFASAHGLEPGLQAEAGRLPGDLAYIFERPAEWLTVNLFTASTKKKQAKKLEFASERVAELGALLYTPAVKEKYLNLALDRYRYYLESAEDMAEKIIFIDGHQIAIADKFEEETRLQEKYLLELKEGLSAEKHSAQLDDALVEARSQNEKIFRFMVEKYQGTDAEIRKHQAILLKHLTLVREALLATPDETKIKETQNLLTEAEKFRKAGLNDRAYDFLKEAKDLVY